MLSFHNDEKVKEKYVNRIKKHKEMDNILQGTAWKNGKGCAVGCTLENYDHSRYPIELGLPEWLARLEDAIFEGLSVEKAKEWPLLFLESIPVGVCVEKVKHQLAIKRLDRLLATQNERLKENKENKKVSKVIAKIIKSTDIIKKCHQAKLEGKYRNWAVSAARLAGLAAESAESIKPVELARSLAESAWATWEAAESVGSAESAIRSPLWSARSTAWSANAAVKSVCFEARLVAWQQEADDLIDLLSNCK